MPSHGIILAETSGDHQAQIHHGRAQGRHEPIWGKGQPQSCLRSICEVQLILPITLSQTASIGHVYSLKWAQSSGAVTSGRERYDVAMTLNDGIISVGTGVSQLYRLYPGWNLISFPVELEGRGFDSFLGIAILLGWVSEWIDMAWVQS